MGRVGILDGGAVAAMVVVVVVVGVVVDGGEVAAVVGAGIVAVDVAAVVGGVVGVVVVARVLGGVAGDVVVAAVVAEGIVPGVGAGAQASLPARGPPNPQHAARFSGVHTPCRAQPSTKRQRQRQRSRSFLLFYLCAPPWLCKHQRAEAN